MVPWKHSHKGKQKPEYLISVLSAHFALVYLLKKTLVAKSVYTWKYKWFIDFSLYLVGQFFPLRIYFWKEYRALCSELESWTPFLEYMRATKQLRSMIPPCWLSFLIFPFIIGFIYILKTFSCKFSLSSESSFFFLLMRIKGIFVKYEFLDKWDRDEDKIHVLFVHASTEW